jgi:hypothetical protein
MCSDRVAKCVGFSHDALAVSQQGMNLCCAVCARPLERLSLCSLNAMPELGIPKKRGVNVETPHVTCPLLLITRAD